MKKPKAPEAFEPTVDIKKLSELTGLSENYIEKAKKHNGLPSYKVGSRVLYRLSEVNAWLKQRHKAG